MRKLIFVLSQISQPRCLKRIETLDKINIPYEAWGFDKKLYNENLSNYSVTINRFNFIRTKNKSVFNLIRRTKCIGNLIRKSNKNDVFYLFGFDIALYVVLSFKKINYIYEEADISYAGSNKFLFYVFRFIENKIRSKSLLTVFTSEGFVDYFYKKDNVPNNIFVQPNKLHHSLVNAKRNISVIDNVDKMKFGFIGLIRYKTIFNFAETIGEFFQNHEFHFWGDTKNKAEVDNLINKYSNIYSHGSFKNPDDLEKIYSQIDILVVCYDTMNFNTKLAEPNKLYESILFCKPIIVSKNTFLERRVLEWNIGYSVNAQNINEIKEFIKTIRKDDLNRMSQTQKNINIETLIDNPDNISNRILKILKKK